ncbi:MAG: hypothetical protein HFF66_08775 [Oscillospiraceae bacterium]|jgi:glycerophosphoryl diester phosphodiesterase|nr:hypothetical protein [Oscillospiraceae bacterium]
MLRFEKHTTLIYALIALAALEFACLAGILIFDSASFQPAASDDMAAPAGTALAADSAAPAWLEPAPALPEEQRAPAGELTAAEILDSARLIAHGMGSLDGETTLNCLEGFRDRYERGVRVFEVDLRLTSDQKVVLRHDWRAGWQRDVSETSIPTAEEFLDKPILNKYTAMSFKDLLYLMRDYPDICIVTDTKFTEAEIVRLQFEAMLQDARELGLSYLFDRMIIQIYSPLMFQVVDSLHHFSYYIYTLYYDGFSRTEEDFRERAAFCRQNQILGLTMWDYWWREDFAPIAAEYGLKVYTHTVNEPEEALALLEGGIGAVYTDELVPDDLAVPPDASGETEGGAETTDEAGDPGSTGPASDDQPSEKEGE